MKTNIVRRSPHPIQSGLPEQALVLDSVDVQACIRSNLAETTVEQTYCNTEDQNIEAVYTFALPSDAVLLDVTLELNGRTMKGIVRALAQAEQDYESAVEEGDSAVLLRQLGPGMYSMNVANLMAGETARVRYRYAQVLRWQSDTLRYYLPTTIPPRYGPASSGGMLPHETPEQVLDTGRKASVTVSIEGALATARVTSPSHPIAGNLEGDRNVIRIQGGDTAMDRDFVLVLERREEASHELMWGKDGDATVALAVFNPRVGSDHAPPARCVKLVVDCSGSMAGDSIEQARAALAEVLRLMRPNDRFNVLRFGSQFEQLFESPVPVNDRSLGAARRYVDALDADLGGTELRRALHAAFNDGPAGGDADVLLVTDGNVYEDEGMFEQARSSGQRLFAVGVGSAVSEDMVRGLSAATGGACELVSPRENMAEVIVRQFRRITQPKVHTTTIRWPGEHSRQAPSSLGGVYCGDTLPAFAWLDGPPGTDAAVTYLLENGHTFTQRAAADPLPMSGDTIARLAAATRLKELDEDAARDLAVRYQLITQHTSCVLVHERAGHEKATSLPALRKVDHTLSAGWGGYGSARMLGMASASSQSRDFLDECAEPSSIETGHAEHLRAYRMSARSQPIPKPEFNRLLGAPHGEGPFDALVECLNSLIDTASRGPAFPAQTLRDLESMGLPSELRELLEDAAHDAEENRFMVYAVLAWLHKHYRATALDASIVKRARVRLSWKGRRRVALVEHVDHIMTMWHDIHG